MTLEQGSEIRKRQEEVQAVNSKVCLLGEIFPLVRLHLQNVTETSPRAGYEAFKYMSLWGTLHIQITR